MEAKDFEFLVEMCKTTINEENHKLTFSPRRNKDAKRLAEILKNNALENVSLEDFRPLIQKHHPLYKARKKIKKFTELSPKQVSVLPMEQKVCSQ